MCFRGKVVRVFQKSYVFFPNHALGEQERIKEIYNKPPLIAMRGIGLFVIYSQFLLRHLLKAWYPFPITYVNVRYYYSSYHELLDLPKFLGKAFLCLPVDSMVWITDRVT